MSTKRIPALAAAVFALALAIRLLLAFGWPALGTLPPTEMERTARNWAETGELGNPYLTPTGPTAHVAPLYPLMLGLVYRIGGTEQPGPPGQWLLGCTLSALRCALMLPLAVVLGLGLRTGLIAAIASCFVITAVGTEIRGAWEAPAAALALMFFVWLAARREEKPWSRPGRDAFLVGLAAGAALLLSPALLFTLAALLAWTLARHATRRQWLTGMALAAVGALLVLAPWVYRNARVLGSPVLFRTNFGLELSLAYNDAGEATALDKRILERHPLKNAAVSQRVATVGEVAFNRERQREALDWIAAHPGKAAELAALHVFYFWFPPAPSLPAAILRAMLTIAAILGYAAVVRKRSPAGVLIGLVWITFPLIYYVLYWSSRYRYPMDWTLLLCSAALLDYAMERAPRLVR